MIVEGLKFAVESELTRKEIQILLAFIDEPKSVSEVAIDLKDKKQSLHNRVITLKYKGILELKDKGPNGTLLYGITKKVEKALKKEEDVVQAPVFPID